MDELKKAAFNAIYKDGCDNCGDWIDTLVNCYSEEVVDTLGNNPNEVYAELEDIWETILGNEREVIIQFNSNPRSKSHLSGFSSVSVFNLHEAESSSSVQKQANRTGFTVRPTNVWSNNY